jgi:hypothetical protein
MKKIFLFLSSVAINLLFPAVVLAENRNIFGLHLTQLSDIYQAKDVVNSSGGDWGWVTIVLRTDQLNHQAWQEFFDNCRKFHLIPIVRLATIMDNDVWKRPVFSDIDNLANFLDSLNWPTLKQHVVLFNEVNHGQEWGGAVDSKNYTDIAIYAADKFKQLNTNFLILGAALDLAAPSQPKNFESAENYYREIFLYQPLYFSKLDALASHSYPNHGFNGKPTDTGKTSIRGYLWELDYLKRLGISKNFLVYLTETGWPHREGRLSQNQYYTLKTAASFLQSALSIWQGDYRVMAVTPFIYNYPNPPFDHFSWLKPDGGLYPEYQTIVDLAKYKNSPSQATSFQLTRISLPLLIFPNIEYAGHLYLKNTGQSIWGETNFCLKPTSLPDLSLSPICTSPQVIYPGQIQAFEFKFEVLGSINHKTKISLSWQDVPSTEISPIFSSSRLYHPPFTFFQNLISTLKRLLSHSILN